MMRVAGVKHFLNSVVNWLNAGITGIKTGGYLAGETSKIARALLTADRLIKPIHKLSPADNLSDKSL